MRPRPLKTHRLIAKLPLFISVSVFCAAAFAVSARAQTAYEPYAITTLAGSGAAGSADGTGAAAEFKTPLGIAVDSGGTIYVADNGNQTIRKITPNGSVTTFAGSPGMAGSADGTGSAARFNGPSGVAIDTAGNVYVSEFDNHTIRKISPNGAVSTLAGSPGITGSADGTGAAARFSYLGHLAIDGSGNLIVADYANQTIRKVTPAGVVTTIAGSPGVSGSNDGPASQARFNYPRGVAVDSLGNIYVSEEQNYTIRKIATNGIVSTVAGLSQQFGSSDGTGNAARFFYPEGLAVDSADNIYVADSNNYLIRKVTPDGVVTTLAGVPNQSGSSDGTGSAALFSGPYGVATNSSGTLYIADSSGNKIRAGRPANGTGGTGGLSATTLTVNGSASASALPADFPIVFEATQNDAKDRVLVRVQSAMGAQGTWTDLNTGFNGRMVYNSARSDTSANRTFTRYVLTTENYPDGNNIFFRAVSSTPGKADTVSKAVGPFNIASAKTHLPPTRFQIEGMMEMFYVFIASYPLDFYATIGSQASGLGARLQTSTTPEVEGSWTDLNDGNSGQMGSVGSGAFDLRTGKYPAGSGIYFRVVASATGMGDSISNFVGPFQLATNVLPTVTITSPNGNGTDANPLKLSSASAQSFVFSASGADADGSVQRMELFDGAQRKDSEARSSASITLRLSQGRHTLKAVATDNLGAKSSAEVVVEVAPVPASAVTYTMKQSGDWNNAGNWTPSGIPRPLDTANLGDNTVSLASGARIVVASLSGGSLSGAGSSSMLTVTKNFKWTGGTISNATLEIANGATGEIKAIFAGPDFNLNGAALINDAGGTITVDVDSFLNSSVAIRGKNTGSSLNNAGTINFQSPSLLDQTTEPFLIDLITKQARKKLQGLASITNTGSCYLNGVVLDLTATGNRAAQAQAAGAPVGFIQAGGLLDFGPSNQAGTIIGDVVVNGGTVTGSGAVVGNLTNNGGLIAPGHSAGVLSVTGNYTQAAGGTLLMEAGGLNANNPDYDQLQVGGTANLSGTLDVQAINGYTPAAGDVLVPVSYGSSTGSFSTITSNATLTLGSTGATMALTGANLPTGQPANISTRMKVLTNDKVLIGGFIVTGPGGSTKKVLIRGMGPSLSKQGVSGVLSDPFLELNLPDGSTLSNDDWAQGPRKGEIPTGFQPLAKESVIVADLAPGAYTVIESGVNGGTGVGLTEVYDFDPASSAQLANISTRGFVDTGDNVMIGGFIISGNQPAQILVRATGPSLKLPPNNLSGVLEDPTLELTDANGNVIANDDWRATQEQEIIASTVAPSDNHEPAILATLVPGGYTAIVRGRDDTTGIAVVEAYKIK